MGINNDPRDEDCCKQVGQQTDGEGGCKSLYRAGAKQKQDGRRDDGCHVGIDDGDPGMSKTLIDGRGRRLACPHLFTDALKDQHVRVHAHADGQNDSGNAG